MQDTLESTLEGNGSRKRDKLRSAWISFAGRIVAQLIGAIATVTLGVVVLGGRQSSPAPSQAEAAVKPTVLIATPVRTHGETVVVMMPAGPDGKADNALAVQIAESYERTKAESLRADALRQTPTDPPAPRSDDPWDGSHATPGSPRE